jgi:uncharacterized protein YcfJ
MLTRARGKLRKRYGRSHAEVIARMREDLTFAEEYLDQHSNIAGAAIGALAGAILGGAPGGAVGTAIGGVLGAGLGIAMRRERREGGGL